MKTKGNLRQQRTTSRTNNKQQQKQRKSSRYGERYVGSGRGRPCHSHHFKQWLALLFVLGFLSFLHALFWNLCKLHENVLLMENSQHGYHHVQEKDEEPFSNQQQQQQKKQPQTKHEDMKSNNNNLNSQPKTTREMLEMGLHQRNFSLAAASRRTPLAWKVVTAAFQETYAHLQRCCDDKRAAINGKTMTTTTTNMNTTNTNNQQELQEQQQQQHNKGRLEDVFVDCLQETRTAAGSWPWWFQTLLRDASPSSPLHWGYHDLWMRLPPQTKPQNHSNEDNHINNNNINTNNQRKEKDGSSSSSTTTTMSSSSSSSLLHFCAIEKVSSTTWVSVQCRLNNNVSTFKEAQRQALKLAKDKKNKTTTKKSKNIVVTIGGGLDCALQLTKDEMDSYHFDNSNIQLHQVQNNNITNNNITNNNNNKRATAARPQKAVFLRDPLERFLSAFVDKCIRYPYQKHCQPNLLFSSSEDSIRQSEHLASGRNTSQRQQRHSRTYKDRTLTTDLIPSPAQRQQRRRQELNPVNNNNNNNVSVVTKTATTTTTTAADYQYMFDAYIDIFPLSWNVHFYPQALYCNGLFLDLLDEYDFIGTYCSYIYIYICQNIYTTTKGTTTKTCVNENMKNEYAKKKKRRRNNGN